MATVSFYKRGPTGRLAILYRTDVPAGVLDAVTWAATVLRDTVPDLLSEVAEVRVTRPLAPPSPQLRAVS